LPALLYRSWNRWDNGYAGLLSKKALLLEENFDSVKAQSKPHDGGIAIPPYAEDNYANDNKNLAEKLKLK